MAYIVFMLFLGTLLGATAVVSLKLVEFFTGVPEAALDLFWVFNVFVIIAGCFCYNLAAQSIWHYVWRYLWLLSSDGVLLA